MRLTALTLKNFKGVGEEGARIVFSPITLLFGPNNAGKSSIIQALHLAREIFCNTDADLDRINSIDGGISLGTFRDYVHNHEIDRKVSIGIEFDVNRGPFGCTNIQTAGVTFTIYWNKEKSKPLLNQLDIEINDKHLTTVRFTYNKWNITADIGRFSLPIREVSVNSEQELDNLKQSVEHIWSLKGKGMDYTSELSDFFLTIKEELLLNEFYEYFTSRYSLALELLESEELLQGFIDKDKSLSFTIYGASNLASWIKYIDTIIYQNLILKLRKDNNIDITTTYISEGWNGNHIETDTIDEVINHFSDLLKTPLDVAASLLKDIIYIGPLRDIPERGTAYKESIACRSWARGLAAWDTIAFLPDDQFNLLNRFINSQDFMKAHYQLTRERYLPLDSDSDLADGLRGMVEDFEKNNTLIGTPGMDFKLYPFLKEFLLKTPTVFIKLLDTEDGLIVEPHDMGTGISQLIPCLTSAAVAQGSQIVAIEQPELHIHPAWQTALADVFIYAISKEENKPLFILETHSEHLLLRLLRRIRNANRNTGSQQFKLISDDLAVYWVGRNAYTTEIYPLIVDSTGSFCTPWPEGFFEERDEELFG